MPESLETLLEQAAIEAIHQGQYPLASKLSEALSALQQARMRPPTNPALDETTRLVPMIGATRNEQPNRFPTHCAVIVRRAGQLIHCGAVIVRVDGGWAHMGGESDHTAQPSTEL